MLWCSKWSRCLWVRILTAPHLLTLPHSAPGKAVENGQSAWAQVGDLAGAPDSWLRPGPVSTSQWLREWTSRWSSVCLSPPLSLSVTLPFKQTSMSLLVSVRRNKSIFKKEKDQIYQNTVTSQATSWIDASSSYSFQAAGSRVICPVRKATSAQWRHVGLQDRAPVPVS